MREVVHQAVQHRQDFVAAVQAHMDVDSVDHHLAAPPLGAVDELGVAGLVRDRLQLGRAERMASGAEDLNTHGVCDFPHCGKGTAEIGLGLRHRFADAGDKLHCVEQEFLLDVGVFVVLVEFGMVGCDAAQHFIGHGRQFAGLRIDQRQLPFHTKS
ncbi:hypothetical protein D9M72_442660 [compost metagenome]